MYVCREMIDLSSSWKSGGMYMAGRNPDEPVATDDSVMTSFCHGGCSTGVTSRLQVLLGLVDYVLLD